MSRFHSLLKVVGILLSAGTTTSCADSWRDLATKLENTNQAKIRIFQLRDDKGHGMDCLDVFQPSGPARTGYFGVSHSLKKGIFSVHLTHSTDLRIWHHVKELDQHASQATIQEAVDGSFLLAYEKDAPNSCWMRLRHFSNLKALKAGRFSQEFDIPRTLAPTAEGTPSIETVDIKKSDISQSEITLRFHYYENARVDQLARGTLKNFQDWNAKPSTTINSALKKRGGHGNLGDRSKFQWKQKDYSLQEVQDTRRDWSSWGLFLCDKDGLPLKKISVETPGKSTAFSNPSASSIRNSDNEPLLVFTAFLHSKGSAPNEAGQMLAVFEAK
jgi:hypothetical protein|tara:strand:+ start:1431 stop:2417 length:987 start_codon:yes stop_codon:yes gene_type:complete